MAAKSRVDAVEADWQVYNETYVATIGVAADMAAIAATLLGRTRSADLWRYPIAENVKAIEELAVHGVPMSVVSNAAGQIEWVLESGLESVNVGRAHLWRCGRSSTQKLWESQNPTHRFLNLLSWNTQKLHEIEFSMLAIR